MKVTTHLHLVPTLSINWSCTSTSTICLHSVEREHFHYTTLYQFLASLTKYAYTGSIVALKVYYFDGKVGFSVAHYACIFIYCKLTYSEVPESLIEASFYSV